MANSYRAVPVSTNLSCPHCMVPLHVTERERVEIDYCPQCRGVWLDRGELDKLMDRSHTYERDRRHREDDEDDRYRRGGSPERRKPFLKRFFDFD